MPNSPRRRVILPHVRRAVYDRDGAACVFCGSVTALELDHVIPWSQGGSDASWNLRILCARCNRSRGTRATSDDTTTRPPTAPRCTSCAALTPTTWGWCTYCHAYNDINERDIDRCPDPDRCGCATTLRYRRRQARRTARRGRH